MSPKHARDAYEYVDREELAFWPEVFLALRGPAVFNFQVVDENMGYGIAEFDLLAIKKSRQAISRVDGNHRLYFANGEAEGMLAIEKTVSFCLATGLTLKKEIKLFRDINNNQRRMNTSHLDNIKLSLAEGGEIAQKDPMLYIADKLATESASPLHGLVYTGGKTDVKKFIPLRTLRTGLEYMFSRPSRLTATKDLGIQTLVVKNYFSALKRWQPDAWRSPKDYLLLRGAGLWGACFLGSEVIDRALAKGNYKIDDMLQILKSGVDWDWGRNGSFAGFSGRSGAVKIRDMIAAEFQDESGVSLKQVMRQIASDL